MGDASTLLGDTRPALMAEMALTRMRPKIAEFRLALERRFDDHHALMLLLHLGHIDQLTATIDRLDAEVAREIALFDDQLRRLCTVPGIARRTARGHHRPDRGRHGTLPDRRQPGVMGRAPATENVRGILVSESVKSGAPHAAASSSP